MKTVLKNPAGKVYLTITYDSQNNWIHNEWEGTVLVDDVIQGGTEVLKVMRQTNCKYILNDNRLITGSWMQANDWIEQTWMPEALSLGLRRFAHIVPPAILGVSSAEEMLNRVNTKFEMHLFGDIRIAIDWLKTAQKSEVNK